MEGGQTDRNTAQALEIQSLRSRVSVLESKLADAKQAEAKLEAAERARRKSDVHRQVVQRALEKIREDVNSGPRPRGQSGDKAAAAPPSLSQDPSHSSEPETYPSRSSRFCGYRTNGRRISRRQQGTARGWARCGQRAKKTRLETEIRRLRSQVEEFKKAAEVAKASAGKARGALQSEAARAKDLDAKLQQTNSALQKTLAEAERLRADAKTTSSGSVSPAAVEGLRAAGLRAVGLLRSWEKYQQGRATKDKVRREARAKEKKKGKRKKPKKRRLERRHRVVCCLGSLAERASRWPS